MTVMKRLLKGILCPYCGDEKVRWGLKRETRTSEEVLVHCDSCNHEFRKRVIQSADVEEPREIAKEIVEVAR